jgi:regulator of protease activity HflC (stomatin/prohibitin superfamily)
MQRVISRQAEAERERRAKIIAADGEFQAATKLSEAAAIINREPAAITLRYLQTLVEIGTEKNTTIVFPLPLDLLGRTCRQKNLTVATELAVDIQHPRRAQLLCLRI